MKYSLVKTKCDNPETGQIPERVVTNTKFKNLCNNDLCHTNDDQKCLMIYITQTKFLSHIVWMWRDPDKKAKQIVQLATYTIVK